MKKLFILSLAISFFILSAGTGFSSEPRMDILDRHAVWTDNDLENTDHRNPNTSNSNKFNPNAVMDFSGKGFNEVNGSTKIKDFSWLQETKSFEFEQGHQISS